MSNVMCVYKQPELQTPIQQTTKNVDLEPFYILIIIMDHFILFNILIIIMNSKCQPSIQFLNIFHRNNSQINPKKLSPGRVA